VVKLLPNSFTLFQYPFFLWAALAVVWCALVCSSRIYLGMHSIAVRTVFKLFAPSAFISQFNAQTLHTMSQSYYF
jgi:hypothetical protein